MSAPGTYGPEHAVNAVSFRRKLDHGHVVTIVCGAGTHVTYRMSNGVEATLPRPTFDQDFEPDVSGVPSVKGATADGLATFTAYFVKNYPGPETVIFDPYWHAPKLYRAATFQLVKELAEVVDAKNFADENRTFQMDRAEKAEAELAALKLTYAALVRAGLENCEDIRVHLGKSEEWSNGFRMALTGLAEGLPS